jgi:two-component system response regulator
MNEHVILLVEDNSSDEELTLLALRKGNTPNKIVVARDGAEALDYLFGRGAYAGRDTGDIPQAVLLDLNLPKISGVEVLRAIRADARTKMLPVVILTSSKEKRDLAEGYASGANSYIVKPVDFVQFSEAVQQLGKYWTALNQPPPHSAC